jgi:hypothetical protein
VAARTIADYIATAGGWRGEVMRDVDAIIRRAAPKATASIKWAQPVYEHNGPFAYMKVATNHVTFGFWRGAELSDPKGLLETSGSRMAHVKIAAPDEVRATQFAAWVREAVRLNDTKGDPTKRVR